MPHIEDQRFNMSMPLPMSFRVGDRQYVSGQVCAASPLLSVREAPDATLSPGFLHGLTPPGPSVSSTVLGLSDR
jgi:hypothetical protein